MILIVTHKNDFTVDYVIEKLNKKGIDYYRFNCENIDSKEYIIEIGSQNTFSINSLDNITSVWFRRTMLPEINNVNNGEKIFLLREYDALLSNIFNLFKLEKWLSNPKYIYIAENKLIQLKKAQEIGFKIPDTLVSNSKIALKKFIKNHNSNVIIKPLNQGRINNGKNVRNIFTNKIDKNTIDKIKEYTLTPSIIQSYIEKEYELRVTVVNDKVFSAKIDSQTNENTKIDWRREKIKFTIYSLPNAISQMCVQLVKELNLSFGAIDLIKTKNGSYIFLEINPNGQWAWIEFDTGLKISDEIIKFLTS
ncbi:hypothetical protein UMM65_08075 [Aureibaculum sp. 2210JD6-5]|uniref:MvdC/MvdD family ATP grasp protein n=1 Tax=Aureibaculum sp. 2210JD6-5 TaxID=3103957 RepID=UPI002AAC7DC2|nr:hypothetical protein [Aureibaculum sp. 2210JD6-5]MDY7395196.1 hypothetical protein [Aureibaculum sp. 2210JD6-5]